MKVFLYGGVDLVRLVAGLLCLRKVFGVTEIDVM